MPLLPEVFAVQVGTTTKKNIRRDMGSRVNGYLAKNCKKRM